MTDNLTLGSLFDGIGGFPLAASRHGITPVWASEIESNAVSVTGRYFPDMAHLGDICKINGAEIEPADIIAFGSPCQDLSIAGNRAGLAGKRSGLFGEAIRIIREMRGVSDGRYPTWAVWENVPGALSSDNGLDFRIVLEAFTYCKIPMPGSGRWAGAGMVRGKRCDIAWRILDAQFWGVPQRRRRIFLVADFRGRRAAEILFKPEGKGRNHQEGGTQREETTADVGEGVNRMTRMGGRFNGPLDVCPTCTAMWGTGGNNTPVSIGIDSEMNAAEEKIGTLRAHCSGGSESAVVVAGFNGWRSHTGTLEYEEERAPCLNSTMPGNVIYPDDVVAVHQNQCGEVRAGKAANTLNANSNASGRNAPLICVSDTQTNATIDADLCPALNCMHEQLYISKESIIRRLMPIECERLQGFPDGWTEGFSDSARYRMIGNSIALPCVEYIMAGIEAAAKR